MPSELVPAEEVFEALEDALAIVREFDGRPIEEKLARFGITADVLQQVMEARWVEHQSKSPEEQFAVAWGEALLTGQVLERRKHERHTA